MEIDKIASKLVTDVDKVDELLRRFRSKRALYSYIHDKLLFNLPPYRDCGLKFLSQGKCIKHVHVVMIVVKEQKELILLGDIAEFDAPKWPELSNKAVLKYFEKDKDLTRYLPDYDPKQPVSRIFLWQVLFTVR